MEQVRVHAEGIAGIVCSVSAGCRRHAGDSPGALGADVGSASSSSALTAWGAEAGAAASAGRPGRPRGSDWTDYFLPA